MTEAETILKMIETVDPADTAKLDEIDARLWCLINGHIWTEFSANGQFFYTHKDGYKTVTVNYRDAVPEYTRSRDALKAIRPERWNSWYMENTMGDCRCYASIEDGRSIAIPDTSYNTLPTEELAELHAIIQAIAYERSK